MDRAPARCGRGRHGNAPADRHELISDPGHAGPQHGGPDFQPEPQPGGIVAAVSECDPRPDFRPQTGPDAHAEADSDPDPSAFGLGRAIGIALALSLALGLASAIARPIGLARAI